MLEPHEMVSCLFAQIELADGRGWYPWDRGNLAQRFGLTAVQYVKGQRVEAKEEIRYSSGDLVQTLVMNESVAAS